MNFTLEHSLEICEIHLNQTENGTERKISFIDANRDLHLSPVHKRDLIKLCAMADSFLWNDKNDILSCIADGRLHVWYYPNAIYVDKTNRKFISYVYFAARFYRKCYRRCLSTHKLAFSSYTDYSALADIEKFRLVYTR